MVKLTAKQKEFRKETSRLISMANKRIKRLENSEFNTSPAYQKWLKDGGEKFTIRGKTQQEVRNEYFRVKNYLDSATSSITGTKRVLTNVAENTGMVFKSKKDLHNNAKAFFELASKVDEYLKVSNRGSEAIGYQRIWKAINMYVQDNDLELNNVNIDSLIDKVANMAEQKLLQDNRNSYDSFFSQDWSKL